MGKGSEDSMKYLWLELALSEEENMMGEKADGSWRAIWGCCANPNRSNDSPQPHTRERWYWTSPAKINEHYDEQPIYHQLARVPLTQVLLEVQGAQASELGRWWLDEYPILEGLDLLREGE